MGEIVEMMEEGILCQECGAYIPEKDQIGIWSSCEDYKKEKNNE